MMHRVRRIALGLTVLAVLVAPNGARAASSPQVRLLTADQRTALTSRTVLLSVGAGPGSLRLGLTGQTAGRRGVSTALALTRSFRFARGVRQRVVALSLSAAGSRVLSRCRALRLVAVARQAGRAGSSSREFVLDRARCAPVSSGTTGVRAGVARRSIVPSSDALATNVGGYGNCLKCPTRGVEPGDGLDVRAMVLRRGARAVVMVTADLEGWFAGYKQGAGLGINDLRAEAAQELKAHDHLDVGPKDIIVQSVHCHACPTVVGIWGQTNVSYLRYVYAQTRAAIREAAASARPASLRYTTADLGYVNDVLVGQANANEGWPIDTQANILQASDARTGDTIATWATVPAHGNIVFGPQSHLMSSDYFGAADRWLEGALGGTAIVGPATLGDQTTPMQGDKSRRHVLGLLGRLGALVGSTVSDALAAHATPIPADAPLAGAETYLMVPATNPLLTASNCTAAQQEIGIEIDRSCVPPYAVAPATIGAWFTTLRVGPLAIASEPGEAFPHVTFAMRRALRPGAREVFVMGQAQDQLGYYYEPFAFPTTFVYSADHNIFHASMALAEGNVQTQITNGQKVGFATTPSAADPRGIDFTRLTKPGIQAWAYPTPLGNSDIDELEATIGVYRARARSGDAGLPAPLPDALIDFGDGSRPLRRGTAPGGSSCCIELGHIYPQPGNYRLTATLRGTSETWTSIVSVRAPGDITNTPRYPIGF